MLLAQKQTYRSVEQNRKPPKWTHNSVVNSSLAKQERASNRKKKDNLFNKWCWENRTATCRRMNLDHFVTPDTRTHSNRKKDLPVRQETPKTLEERQAATSRISRDSLKGFHVPVVWRRDLLSAAWASSSSYTWDSPFFWILQMKAHSVTWLCP